jgi:hypothetical protein
MILSSPESNAIVRPTQDENPLFAAKIRYQVKPAVDLSGISRLLVSC